MKVQQWQIDGRVEFLDKLHLTKQALLGMIATLNSAPYLTMPLNTRIALQNDVRRIREAIKITEHDIADLRAAADDEEA